MRETATLHRARAAKIDNARQSLQGGKRSSVGTVRQIAMRGGSWLGGPW